jgi:octaprenyl-diphosphate synthase
MRNFGEKVGIAFQIKDDLFDYGTEKVGKPTVNDIREKKLSLPLIYTLNKADKSIRKQLIYILKNKHKNQTQINFVIEQVIEAGGIDYATNKMIAYRDEALSILHQFNKTPVRDELESLVRFTTDRKY